MKNLRLNDFFKGNLWYLFETLPVAFDIVVIYTFANLNTIIGVISLPDEYHISSTFSTRKRTVKIEDFFSRFVISSFIVPLKEILSAEQKNFIIFLIL